MTRHQGSFEVAVSGAGLAGASLALWLARRGVKVALVDASTFPRDKVCGEFLSPECWGVLERMGLADQVERSGYHAIRRVRISTPTGREVTAEVVGADGLPGIGLSRFFLDDLIVREARIAGADVFEGARVVGPIVESGRVVGVSVSSREPDGPSEIRARITIAADGRTSTLVKQVGKTFGRSWFRPQFFGLKRHLIVHDRSADEEEGTVGLHLVRGGYGGTCRIEGGSVTNLCAMLPSEEVRSRRGDLDRVARESLGKNPALAKLLEASEPSSDWKTVSDVVVKVSTPTLPGILFAGDCQGTVDPLGGQGMTMALLGAEMMVPFVERGLALEEDGYDSYQEACQDEWRRRFAHRIALCRAFHHFLVNPAIVDVSSRFGSAASRFLTGCYRQTRERNSATD
jgi:menaquinone-9 beta-reductase